jgi:MFS family permease
VNPAFVPPLLTGIALLAVLVALRGVAQTVQVRPVALQLVTIYRLVAALLVFRLVGGVTTGFATALATVATMLIAAWLPLAGLRLVEELTRRHASRFVKLWALGGALGFSVVGLTFGILWSAAALVALALFQAITVAIMLVLLIRRRSELPRAERATADTFLVALAANIPLALTDFGALIPELGLRGGVFAVLLLVLATSRIIDGGGAPRRLLADIALCLGGGGMAALGTNGDMATTGFAIALTALALLVERFARRRTDDGGLVHALATIDATDTEAVLASHPLLASGRIVEGVALADYPASAIAALTRYRVVHDATQDEDARDAARDLLDAHAATHLVRLASKPPRFLAVSAGSFATARTSDELTLLARLIERPA